MTIIETETNLDRSPDPNGPEGRAQRRRERKAREATLEQMAREIFNRPDQDRVDQAIDALGCFGDVLLAHLDLEVGRAEQSIESQYADRELARVLRMLEGKKRILDSLYGACRLNEDLMERARLVIAAHSPAEA